MSLFGYKPHRHKWWLLDSTTYSPPDRPNSGASYTLFTYVCRDDRSHTKQVRLQGHQEGTAEVIFQRQRDDQGLDAIPDSFKKAFRQKEP